MTATLPVNRFWFDELSAGRCRVELRAATPYWLGRLKPGSERRPLFATFVDGYRASSPRLTLEVLAVDVVPGASLDAAALRAHGLVPSQDVVRLFLGRSDGS